MLFRRLRGVNVQCGTSYFARLQRVEKRRSLEIKKVGMNGQRSSSKESEERKKNEQSRVKDSSKKIDKYEQE